jgi:3-phenylpropionate/cinnamic acid dioxygenase small subunit
MTITQAAARDLLFEEAACLDEHRWADWLALYAEDTVFWMPAWANENETTSDPELELNLLYLKGRAALEDRVFRIESGDSFATVPMARTVHLVSNVRVIEVTDSQATIAANWIVHAYGLHGAITRGGRYRYVLRETAGTLLIASKKIVMIDDKLVGPVDIFHI